eukprot:TRINITY_DN3778_c0_g3_i1.p1 TRINITY_DN3778_c0_g3~~TRINITY_DN3778_c0_g3_i1.p1  ORF type:complete len:883 (+),score=143.64 TRINITY_DN3778_c0_g3_i1:597-3245(+)
MKRMVDTAVGVAKESTKSLSRGVFKTSVALVEDASAALLTCVPNSEPIPESQSGLQVRKTLQPPAAPAWMANRESSLNKVVCDLAEERNDKSLGDLPDSDRPFLSLPSRPSPSVVASRFGLLKSPHRSYSPAGVSCSNASSQSSGQRKRTRWSSASGHLSGIRGTSKSASISSDDASSSSFRSFERDSPNVANLGSPSDVTAARSSPREHRICRDSPSGAKSNRGPTGAAPTGDSTWLRRWAQAFWRVLMFILWPIVQLLPQREAQNAEEEAEVKETAIGDEVKEIANGDEVTALDGNRSLRRNWSHGFRSLSRARTMGLSRQLSRRYNDMMGYFAVVNDNRRLGIIESFQLNVELAIEGFFEGIRHFLHALLSPRETAQAIVKSVRETSWTLGPPPNRELDASVQETVMVETAIIGEDNAVQVEAVPISVAMHLDTRTCEDLVLEAGYPFEAMKVVTPDGYVLTLARIPRKDSRKAVLFQHGILDTALGWVSKGVVGSQAFGAYDQGFDVWLGNMRGYAGREHINKRISAHEYWNYSVNEHGLFDIKSMVDLIHSTKVNELKDAPGGVGESAAQPYRLSVVAHSLGGAAVMLYVVAQRRKQEAHRFTRIILLSPAGFHEKTPFLFDVLVVLMPVIIPVMSRIMPGVYIPTNILRSLFHRLAQDFQNLPGLGALVQTVISRFVLGGDSSDWVGAFRQPHYNVHDMPGIALKAGVHLGQMKAAKSFMMFDYGSVQHNLEAYGQPSPVCVSDLYNLVDVPVDVVSGKFDKLIPTSMVVKHHEALIAAGRVSSFVELGYAHLDFTFKQGQSSLAYVMSRLNLDEEEGEKKIGRIPESTLEPPTSAQIAAGVNGESLDMEAERGRGNGLVQANGVKVAESGSDSNS